MLVASLQVYLTRNFCLDVDNIIANNSLPQSFLPFAPYATYFANRCSSFERFRAPQIPSPLYQNQATR